MRVDERIADHQLRALVDPQQLFLQNHAADAIRDRRRRRILEIGDVLVTARLVDTREAVKRQIETLIVLHDGLIQRREQYVGLVALVDRSHHQTVVLARIATYDRSTHITASTVGCEHLALERIFKIAQLVFVKCKC